MSRVLIVFGTTDGHTKKVADALAAAMRASDVLVHVAEAGTCDVSPAGFDGVI